MTIYKRGVYDVEVELEKLGYDYDALLEELIYRITNQGVLWENNDEAYRNFLTGKAGEGRSAEEILGMCEDEEIDLEEYKLEEED